MESAALVGCSILVIEREPLIGRRLQGVLEEAGATVHGAANSVEALHFIDADAISAAVLDFRTSDQDDHRVPRRLAVLGIPFLFCACAGCDRSISQPLALTKPVSGGELIASLRRLLNGDVIRGLAPFARGHDRRDHGRHVGPAAAVPAGSSWKAHER